MDWVMFYAISTAATGVILLISAFALAWQIRELRRATNAQAYSTAIDWLQDDQIRMARRKLFELNESGKIVENWKEEDILGVERVCHTYDIVAIMVRQRMLPKKALKAWEYSLGRSWGAAMPLVAKYREERLAPEFWGNFEWLAKQIGGKYIRGAQK